jgi:hypothetical protein
MMVPTTTTSIGTTSQVPSTRQDHATNSDPWEAAHNLAFMKRSSPASDVYKRVTVNDASNGEILSIPSLASSSDGTTASPGHGGNRKCLTNNEDKAGVDEMLLAAVAMTEFINSPPPSKQYLQTLRKSANTQIIAREENYETSVSEYERNDQQTDRRLSPQVKRHLDFECGEQDLRKKIKHE